MASTAHMLALCAKWIFILCIPLQTMLWPTVTSITFVCIYGIINILTYFGTVDVVKALQLQGIWLYPPEKKPVNYALMLILFCYFAIYFFQFLTLESQLLPASTFWLDPSLSANYSVQRLTDLPVEVTSTVSQSMRDLPFQWARSIQVEAPQVMGTLAPGIICGSGGGFKCFAKVWPTDSGAFVPFPNQFYDVDVLIKPASGVPCTALEVYRTVVDVNLNAIQPLDYPASTIPNSLNRQSVFPPPCNLFNGSSSLCLQVSHTFTPQQYAQEQASQCALYNQQLIFRLPSRAPDVDPESGRMTLDVLLVSQTAASVTLSAAWKADQPSGSWFLSSTFWHQVVDTDKLQGWRESAEDAAVFFKFAIAVIPALFTWYYLSVEFLEYISDSQILFLSIFIELPAILLFLSLGAWLPMAGSIICVIAVNYDVASNNNNNKPPKYWQGYVRPGLLFLKAASNSIQFAWLLALVGQAGWNAFFYELTLRQLYDMSFHFIITYQSSPTWVALMLPVILIVNFAFLLGSAICVVLESITASSPSAAAAAAQQH
jgi:hypothetical protein